MTAYIDSSVLLRVVFGQPNALREWPTIKRGVSSRLILTESLRTLDRLRLRTGLADIETAARRSAILALVASLELIEVDTTVLSRAEQPMPTALGTLDALHLASALLWREASDEDFTMATHDLALALAAQAYGLSVVGAAN